MGLFNRRTTTEPASPLAAAEMEPMGSVPNEPIGSAAPTESNETGTEIGTMVPNPDADRVVAIEDENAELRAQIRQRDLDDFIAAANSMVDLVDPSDVYKFIDMAEMCDSDGSPCRNRVAAAMSQLAADKPYLKRPFRPAPGSADGGRRGTGRAQLSIADIATMSPEQIEAARRGGLLNRAMGIE